MYAYIDNVHIYIDKCLLPRFALRKKGVSFTVVSICFESLNPSVPAPDANITFCSIRRSPLHNKMKAVMPLFSFWNEIYCCVGKLAAAISGKKHKHYLCSSAYIF